MQYAATYHIAAAPQDEGIGDLRVMRNGKLYAHAATLGEAKARIRRVQSIVGRVDRWSIMNGRHIMHREQRDAAGIGE